MNADDEKRLGKRESNRRDRIARIQSAAIAEFSAKGYEETTMDDIAAAADVSRRNLFHYFPTKEDLALHWFSQYHQLLIGCVSERPPEEDIGTAVIAAVIKTLGMAKPNSASLLKLVFDTPALSRGFYARHAAIESALSDALLARKQRGRFDCDLIAMAVVGMLRLNGQRWISEEAPSSALASFLSAVRRFKRLVGAMEVGRASSYET